MAVEISDDDVWMRKALNNIFYIGECKFFMVGNIYKYYIWL